MLKDIKYGETIVLEFQKKSLKTEETNRSVDRQVTPLMIVAFSNTAAKETNSRDVKSRRRRVINVSVRKSRARIKFIKTKGEQIRTYSLYRE